ncbi:DUF1194 domain-containing protein [Marivivens donghaensis]|uniref:DUF1194 domain-containing protein n=1 Tax=Marivivens donghaensis TaxID=1699413 RepID=A0ABX0VYI2_9RHOB|nr:DUF1194 domain-containing protein [Marivivens donghaensis]NIY72286.1 DUF1194 domain-containing protein [Marivivens donghaensis]
MSVTGKLTLVAALFAASPALSECRQALALGLDVSGSVDPSEYRLQLDGLAGALTSQDVSEAILSDTIAPIRLAVYQWSGPEAVKLLVPWTALDSAAAIADVAATLEATNTAPSDVTTAIGAAILTGEALMDQQPECWRHTLDLSGDGQNNNGPRPQDIPERFDMTVNGLVVLGADNDDALISYWKTNVIRGPQRFVETASGFEDYEKAMRRKLLREVRSLALGALQ